MEKLVLIDGNSLINRAFYAMPTLSTKDGIYTNAVYGFMNMFIKMYSEVKPTYVAVAFDMKAPTFRHKMYSEYKGTRKPMPEELRPQIPLLKQLLTTMGVKTFEKEGIEADDIIGTIAKSTKIKTYIYTGDRDSFQLVDDETEVRFTKRGITDVEILNNDNFKEKTGILPYQVIELKALMGDASDNIPGVSGIGEKTAKTLVETYKDIDNLYSHVDELTGKLKEKIECGKDSAYLSKTLATINTKCDIDCDVEKMRFSLPLPASVKAEFVKLEFKALLGKAELFDNGNTSKTESGDVADVQIVTVKDLSSLFVPKNKRIAIVLDDYTASYSDGEKEYVVPIVRLLGDEGFTTSEAIDYLLPLFSSDNKITVYSKKEIKRFLKRNKGIEIEAELDDLAILKYLTDFTGGAETLSEILNDYGLNLKTPAYSMVKLFEKLYKILLDENNEKLYREVELPLGDVLFQMEESGFKIDVNALSQAGKEYAVILDELSDSIRKMTGEVNLNINSPKQLGEVLFEKLKVGKGKKTKTGYSTTAEVLQGLEDASPVIPAILRFRKIQKLQSTYVEGLKSQLEKDTGIIHTVFNQTVTSTGRLSSKEPNLQNIPIRDEEGRNLRKFFVPKSEDRILIGADYSQIELRLMADFSNAESLIKAFNDGADIHSETASKVFNVPINEVDQEMRSKAKAVNFGIIYGISEYGLAKQLKISAKEAKVYIDNYFKTYPEIKEYMNLLVEKARNTGYAQTILGRRRYIRELSSTNYNLRQFGERAAMNMPLQGSSADIIKLAMIGVSKRLKEEGLKSELILQIHDELIIDAYMEEREKVRRILIHEMENAVKLKVNLTVEVGEGKTWFEAK